MDADLGVIGLAVMGQNLVLNLVDKGYRVAVYNRTKSRVDEFVRRVARGKDVVPAYSLAELAQALTPPRKILLMVKAGEAVDAIITELIPLLEPGDVLIDGGNSFFQDTRRRERQLGEHGLLFLGVGISGGEEGARHGPSIMPGGPRAAWDLAGQVLVDIAARAADGEPCCTYLGPDGAGHFVKMVHNGIEYGDMQLISEVYHLMRELLGLSAPEMARIFAEWNREELESYLIEITADILGKIDKETGMPLVELIRDEAEQKGTGKWTAQVALDLGVPVPSLTEAVSARFLSALKEEREQAARVLIGPAAGSTRSTREPGAGERGERGGRGEIRSFLVDLRKALYAGKLCIYAQGFALLKEAARVYEWDGEHELDLAKVAQIWRSGCIIRARLLNHIMEAYKRDPGLRNLLLDAYFRGVIAANQTGWRQVVSQAALAGIPVPVLGSALAYYDAYRAERLPANLIQAQRDYFGAHTYRRLDRPGVFHTEWRGPEDKE
ncbi:MAG: NADP-dependent phosphogluconate dehydrogenase [Firmicutes bacterium]|nr:NADP-dependent phosphogluconate dehydrogenase [Bacillota bacterium]